MPPTIGNHLGASQGTGIVRKIALDNVLAFVDVDCLGVALAHCNFTQLERIAKLVSIFRNGEDRDSLKAERAIDRIIRDNLEANGLIAILKETHINDNGTRSTVEVRRIAAQTAFRESIASERAIEALTARVIDPPSPEGRASP